MHNCAGTGRSNANVMKMLGFRKGSHRVESSPGIEDGASRGVTAGICGQNKLRDCPEQPKANLNHVPYKGAGARASIERMLIDGQGARLRVCA